MAKQKQVLTYNVSTKTSMIKKKIEFFYKEKFFNKWMSKYDFNGLNYQQKQYFMKKMWCDGTIAVSSIKSADNVLAGLISAGVVDMKENNIILTPWAPANRFNIYDYPTHIRLINTRGVKFITAEELELDKDAVVIYALRDHKSVYSSIEAKVIEIIDLEMKKRIALKSQSQPWMFTFAPEDFAQAKSMQEQLENDNPYMYVLLEGLDKAKALQSGAPYIVDKIQAQIDGRVNEVLTMLGVNNLGVNEKKEHLINSEIDANNEDVETTDQAFMNCIEEGWDRVKKVLGYQVDVLDASPEVLDYNEDNQDDIPEDKEDNEDA